MVATVSSLLIEPSGSSSTTKSGSYTVVNGSGNDRVLFVVASCRRGAVRTMTDCTVDGVSGTVWQNISVDGGQACSTAVAYFIDTELPASGGSYTVEITWSSTALSSPFMIVELSDGDQTTPLENFSSNTSTGLAEGGTISSTLSGASGELGFTYVGTADSTSSVSDPTHTAPASSTLIDQGTNGESASLGVAEDTTVASASEAYQWTVDMNSDGTADSVVTGCFSVKDAGGVAGLTAGSLALLGVGK